MDIMSDWLVVVDDGGLLINNVHVEPHVTYPTVHRNPKQRQTEYQYCRERLDRADAKIYRRYKCSTLGKRINCKR
jgi:hypothetical protein